MQDLETITLPRGAERCQYLFYGVIRHWTLLANCLKRHIRKQPRPRLQAVLLVAGFELLDNAADTARHPKIVHHAVERARGLTSAGESRLVNAVLRLLPASMAQAQAQLLAGGSLRDLSLRMSHPEWLVRRWAAAFGEPDTLALLNWNQRPPTTTVELGAGVEPPGGLEPGPREGFFRLRPEGWPAVRKLLEAGRAYVRDPSTAAATDLAQARAGEAVLDCCSAPGGKAWAMLQAAPALLVSVDRLQAADSPRRRQWRENLACFGERARRLEADLLEPDFGDRLLEAAGRDAFDLVLVDVPCTNTGVIRRRPDVRWRLQPGAVEEMAALQGRLLAEAARWVTAGGRLVYSTCSLEAEENAGVVDAFLAGPAGRDFRLEARRLVRPWVDGVDGAGAFRLRRVGRRASPLRRAGGRAAERRGRGE